MEAKDLRIGNIVYDDIDLINGISSLSIHKFNIRQITLLPVKLTEEWLLKLGFTDNSYRDYFLYHPIAEYALISISFRYNKVTLNDSTSISVDDHDLDLDCKYVHQLQNIYFALTGEELISSTNV